MLDYPALSALSEIIRRGSFEAAATALGVTPSAISQRIKGLEERLGQVVIHRGPPATGTPAGLRLMLRRWRQSGRHPSCRRRSGLQQQPGKG